MARQGLDSARALGDPAAIFFIRTNQGLASLFLTISTRPDTRSARRSRLAGTGAEDVADETLLGLAAVEASRGDLDGLRSWPARPRAARPLSAASGEDTIW